jgi:hypothetical protein
MRTRLLLALVISLLVGTFAAAAEVAVDTIARGTIKGELTGVNAEGVVELQLADKKVEKFKLNELMGLAFKPAPEVAFANTTQLKFVNGDLIVGTRKASADGKIAVTSKSLGELKFGINTIFSYYCADNLPNEKRQLTWNKLIELDSRAEDDDIVFLTNSDQVTGVLDTVGEKEVIVKNAETNEAFPPFPWEQVCGFTLAKSQGKKFQPVDKFMAVVLCADGTKVSGFIKEIAGGKMKLEFEPGIIVEPNVCEIAMDQVVKISFKNGRIVYLSDLTPAKVEETPFFGLSFPFKKDKSVVGGRPLTVRGKVYAKGFGVHSKSVMTFNLEKKYDRFICVAGLDDEANGQGNVIFRITVDGQKVFEKEATGKSDPIPVEIDVKGKDAIILEVDFGKDMHVMDRFDWADALLIKAEK